MHASPKMMAAVKAVFGLGLGFLGILIAERPMAALLIGMVGAFVGVAWAGGLIYWWTRSKSTNLYAESLAILLVLVVVAAIIGLPIAAACAAGGYGITLLIAMQIREWQHKEAIRWQDLRASRKD